MKCTENWSDRRYVRREFGQRGWVVTGVADESAAIAAVNATHDNAATKNKPFLIDSRLRAQEPEVDLVGPTTYHVVAPYTAPDGAEIGPAPENPLDRDIQWAWDEGMATVSTDVDAYSRPLVNTAAIPFSSDPPTEVDLLFLIATRYESEFDVRKNIQYRGKVNADRISVPLAGLVEPGQMKLVSYRPLHAYDVNTPYVEVAYRFELGGGARGEADGDGLFDTFKYRIQSKGFEGWYDDGGTVKRGPFCKPPTAPSSASRCRCGRSVARSAAPSKS